MNKLNTIKVQGGEYATVPTRLKEFRETHPNSDIQTTPTVLPDGSVIFKARIVKDQSDPNSMKGTGQAMYSASEMKQPKAFEKLETIAKGRALSDIGYMNNGEIASTEELEEFYNFKIDTYEKKIDNAKDIGELLQIFKGMNSEAQKMFTEKLSEKKKELQDAATVQRTRARFG